MINESKCWPESFPDRRASEWDEDKMLLLADIANFYGWMIGGGLNPLIRLFFSGILFRHYETV